MPRPRLHEREVSLDAALRAFHARGYGATSMKDLEAAMDLRPGSIYATFGSKEGLFEEALQRYGMQMKAEMRHLLEDAETPVAGLRNYLDALARREPEGSGAIGEQARACMVVRTLLETAGRSDQCGGALAEQMLMDVEQMLLGVVRQAQRRGTLTTRLSAARIARLLQAQIIGFRTMSQRSLSGRARTQLAEDISGLIDQLLTSPGAR